MIDRRIKIPKDKDEFIEVLLSGDDGRGPFHLKVDVLAFAAVLGASRNSGTSFEESTKEPIRQDVFSNQGYDTLIDLLAVYKTGSLDILTDTDEKVDERASIFEAYANGGLEILKEKLKGSMDYTNEILLMINEKRRKEQKEGEIDISELFH